METVVSDPLLRCLVGLGKIYSKPVNVEAVTHGLPLKNGRLTPQLFVAAAERAGFRTKLIKRSIRKIHPTTFPAVLMTKDDEAYLVLSEPTKETVELFEPETGGRLQVPFSDFKKAYSGFAILVTPTFNFEGRSNFGRHAPGRSWFWSTIFRFRGFYARTALTTLVINILALASSVFIMNVYDRVVPNKAMDTLWVLAAGTLIAFVFEFILKCLRTFFVDRAGHRVDLILGSQLYEKILHMRLRDRPESSGTVGAQARSYESLREFFTSATMTTLVDLPFVFLFAGVIYMLGGIVALPMIIGVGLAILVALVMQLPISRSVEKAYRSSNQRQAMFVETVNALETVKMSRCESAMQSKMEECVNESAKAESKSRWYGQGTLNFTAFIQHMVTVSMVMLAVFQVSNDKMTMGAMIACILLAGRGMAPLGMVVSLLTRLQQSRRSLIGLNEMMKREDERQEAGSSRISCPSFTPKVSFSDVDFRYGEDFPKVLDGLNVEIESGERVALLGGIGSGKSTLIRLAAGLYEPEAGRVELSGIDQRQLEPAEVRSHIGYMPQDPVLLYGTIRSNIMAGNQWASDEAVWKAVERAGLESFVKSNPRGLDLPVGEGGRTLSGGQRQSVCLARALLNEPCLLIFDEPTSSLDTDSEEKLIVAINDYLAADRSRTLIVATHKRSMLVPVNRIIALEGGRKIADGPKAEVLMTPEETEALDRLGGPPSNQPNRMDQSEDLILAN